MKKLIWFAGFGLGYVLGARAGRERYEQILRTAGRIQRNPAVRATAKHAADAARDAAPVVKETVTGGAAAAAHGVSVAAQKVRHSDGIDLEDSAYPKA